MGSKSPHFNYLFPTFAFFSDVPCLNNEMMTFLYPKLDDLEPPTKVHALEKTLSAAETFLKETSSIETFSPTVKDELRKHRQDVLTTKALIEWLIPYERGMEILGSLEKRQQDYTFSLSGKTNAKEFSERASLYAEALEYFTKAKQVAASEKNTENHKVLKELIASSNKATTTCRQEAAKQQKQGEKDEVLLRKRLTTLPEESSDFALATERLSILRSLSAYDASFREQKERCEAHVEALKKKRDEQRLTQISTDAPDKTEERERIKALYARGPKRILLQNPSDVIPLDEGPFFTKRFYRFFVRDTKVRLSISTENGTLSETLSLPIHTDFARHQFIEEGCIHIPSSILTPYCRIRMSYLPKEQATLLMLETHMPGLEITIGKSYRACFENQPPFQLRAPQQSFILPSRDAPYSFDVSKLDKAPECEPSQFLDELVHSLNRDPLAIASYVQNEIHFENPWKVVHADKCLHTPTIVRNPESCAMQKRGSAWEICSLLVSLLRRAGCRASFAEGLTFILPPSVANPLLKPPHSIKEPIALQLPCVILSTEKQSVPLFPWFKELFVEEGEALHNHLPEAYATTDRFLRHYLLGDEALFKHTGSDGNDTPGLLFIRMLEETLRKKGLSLRDIERRHTIVRRQYTDWDSFPKPLIAKQTDQYHLTNASPPPARIELTIASTENPKKKTHFFLPVPEIELHPLHIRCTAKKGKPHLHTLELRHRNKQIKRLDLDASDNTISFQIAYPYAQESSTYRASITKGTEAALCVYTGYGHKKQLQQLYTRYNQKGRVFDLLAFMGISYFEASKAMEMQLAALYRDCGHTPFGIGLAKFAPEVGGKALKGAPSLRYPQVDMCHSFLRKEIHIPHIAENTRQFAALLSAHLSAEEHRVIERLFDDRYAISTIRLLRLANRKGGGFLTLTPSSTQEYIQNPTTGGSLYYPNISPTTLRTIFQSSQGKEALHIPKEELSYGYTTPGPVEGEGTSSYYGMGTLLFLSSCWHSLIDDCSITMNGGFGSPLSSPYNVVLTPNSLPGTFTPSRDTRVLLPPVFFKRIIDNLPYEDPCIRTPISIHESSLGKIDLVKAEEIREHHLSRYQCAADPVNVATGAFYVDEEDLTLPGPFPLTLRRNYSSLNPIHSTLGRGWKLSLNPYLSESSALLYASEADGSVIVYRYVPDRSRWEPHREDNPELVNLGTGNPFNQYIVSENNNKVLYGVDGSKRFFEDNCLQKWEDPSGHALTFSYRENRLVSIASEQASINIWYNHCGLISEIFTSDGRHVGYVYDNGGNLIQVKLPDGAHNTYEYDNNHRILRQITPADGIIENRYDATGRVIEQRTQAGASGQLIPTTYFCYEKNKTYIKDAYGQTITYLLEGTKPTVITDPLNGTVIERYDALNNRIETVDKRGLTTRCTYDARGNLSTVTRSGVGLEPVTTTYTYDELDRCVCQKLANRCTETIYDEQFIYLPKRVIASIDDTIIHSHEYTYDKRGRLITLSGNGAVSHFEYKNAHLPTRLIQKTGTDDPDVITTFDYNAQGQCVRKQSIDKIETFEYDAMGRCLTRSLYTSKGEKRDEVFFRYDEGGRCIVEHSPLTGKNRVRYYTPSGLIKAIRDRRNGQYAYTLFGHDKQGNQIREIDPLGHHIEKTFDALGQVLSETKEDQTMRFTYEVGGFIASKTSPSNATTRFYYTTNGLISEVIHPDGTWKKTSYDALDRPITIATQNTSTHIVYDDAQRTRREITEDGSSLYLYDANGNLIEYIDPLGNRYATTYDGLKRPVTQTSPSGETTSYSYRGNETITTRPNGEYTISRSEADAVVEVHTYAPDNTLLYHFTKHHDTKNNSIITTTGDITEKQQYNNDELVTRICRGSCITEYQYDLCGRCTSESDGEGRRTTYSYDAFGRPTEKKRPDGTLVTFDYDRDNNLIKYTLPNGTIWKASYDAMGRKQSEALYRGDKRVNAQSYIYRNGRLQTMRDALERIHHYTYDSSSRLTEERVENYALTFAYDALGRLTKAERMQKKGLWPFSSTHHTLVERAYDAESRITQERITIDGTPHTCAAQQHTPSGRTLTLNGHTRKYGYQNGRLSHIQTPKAEIHYSYTLGGALQTKKMPHHTIHYSYAPSGLPKQITSSAEKQTISWDRSGKIASLNGARFTYTPNGELSTTPNERFAYRDNLRVEAPHHLVIEQDDFGRVTKETIDEQHVATEYNAAGEATAINEHTLEWDPWGSLLKVDEWEASYDALGRRLKSSDGEYFYDPEEPQEPIATKHNNKLYHKLLFANSCDAVYDEDKAIYLEYNVLGELSYVSEMAEKLPVKITPYGSRDPPQPIDSLLSYARSLSWHGRAPDSTGLTRFNARYYNPHTGRFLSPDPIGYPTPIDLYTYADGDPANFFDPSGCCSKPLYECTDGSKIWRIEYGCYLIEVGTHEYENLDVMYCAGIQNKPSDVLDNCLYLSKLAGGAKVFSVYNPTAGLFADVYKVFKAKIDQMIPLHAHALAEQFKKRAPKKNILALPHSGGGTYTHAGLKLVDQTTRDRVMVICYNAATFVAKKECMDSINYRSRNDCVSLLSPRNISLMRKGEVINLKRHPQAGWFDHTFQSPTFEQDLKRDTRQIIKQYGGKCLNK